MGNFRELKVWQRSKDLAVFIYKLTKGGQFEKDFGLRDQIRRASVSIPSNIAEGDELGTQAQSIKHFYVAKCSCAEVLTQGIIAFEVEYINKEQFNKIGSQCKAISAMLSRIIKVRKKEQV